MQKSLWAVVPADYDMQKCAWASKDLTCPTLINQPKCLPSVGLWGILTLSDWDVWAESKTPCLGCVGLGGAVATRQGVILANSPLPSGVGLVPAPVSMSQQQWSSSVL